MKHIHIKDETLEKSPQQLVQKSFVGMLHRWCLEFRYISSIPHQQVGNVVHD
jgi:hypothetical protein